MKKTLLIDAQVFQSELWHRGMGKYSLDLLRALSKAKFFSQYDKVSYVINTNLSMDSERFDILRDIIPGSDLLKVNLSVPSTRPHGIKLMKEKNAAILDDIINDKNIDNVEYFVPSLFVDEACVAFPAKAKKLLLFYDLIPFLYSERYKNRINYEAYLDHFKTIFEADVVFNISQTVTNDNDVYLGLPTEKLINIDGASIDRSHLPARKPDIDFPDNIILMPSGDELRKNNLRAVKGFEEFNARYNNKFTLVITSRFSDFTKQELSAYSDNVIFTGNIKEEELQWVYNQAEAVIFPSEYEGLGLPILEAMTVGKKIACSDISVFREISSDAFYVFDEFSPISIANALSSAVENEDWVNKKAKYEDLLKEYSWSNTARKFINGYNNTDFSQIDKKPRIAVITPHPSGYSAIGKVVAESHAEYSKLFDIDYYFDYGPYHREVRPDFLSHIANCYDIAEFSAAAYKNYDAVVYHIGNSDYHLGSIRSALYLPGYIILHDTYLDGAFESMIKTGYISDQRYKLEEKLNGLGLEGGSFLTSVLSNQIGVFTHSEYAARVTKKVVGKDTIVKNISLPVSTPKPIAKTSLRKTFRIGLAGIIADVKGLEIIEMLAMSSDFTDCEINIFGHSFAKPETKEKFKKWPNVVVIENPSDFEFQTRLASLDVLVNYRMEYRGETSLTTLEAMRYGVPVIVRDGMGWYSELPDDVVIKADSTSDVVSKVELLKMNREVAKKISNAALQYTAKNNTHAAYAQALLDTINTKA